MTNDATVSSLTVPWKLGEGLVGRIAANKSLLKEKNTVKRLKFVKEHKKWTKEDWHKALWFPSLNSLQTDKEGMLDRWKEIDLKMSVSHQELNTVGVILWRGGLFQLEE